MTSYGTQSHYSDGTTAHHRFASVDGNFGELPNLYSSELPFSRRRRNSNNDVVKWAMRAVLASPILVLCLWSVGAMMFANKHSTNATVKQRQAQLSPQAPMIMMMPQQTQPMMLSQQQSQQMMSPLQQQAAPEQLIPQQQQAAPEQLLPQQQQQVMMMMSNEADTPAMGQEVETPMQQAAVETPILTATKHAKTMNKHGNRAPVNNRPMPRSPQQLQQPVPQQQVEQQAVQPQQILYYDPKQAMANGRLEVPMTVYDQHGNPIPLQSLKGARILMEPPQPVQSNRRQMSAGDVQKWGESTSQDQSIIVATVAVMALLVGALSARRMRARNVLSACIENEALEDDMAYDTAYTTSQKDNSYYNTFASGGWKGDLEKFDV